ncbi:MAG: hypothetical protein P1U88_06185 [Thalassobaculaceae bacterium]|nr:hypothetical protein [Thalassobaculaceae bacterium]
MLVVAVLMLTLGTVVAGSARAALVSDARAERWVERDAVTLRHAAEGLVASRLARPYDRIEARVPDYSEWVYGWVSSIMVSARLAGVGAQTAGGQLWRGEQLNTDEIVRDLETYVSDAFEAQVIKPEAAEHELFEAWQDAVDMLGRLDRRLATARAAHGASSAYSQPLLVEWYPAAPERLVRGTRSAVLDQMSDPAHADLVLSRSMRPLSIRLLSAATRIVIVPVVLPMIGGAAAVTMVDAGGILGASMFSGAIAAGLWGTDYLLNWVDSAWNRPAFEADLRSAIREQRDRTIVDARNRMDTAFCRVETVTTAC